MNYVVSTIWKHPDDMDKARMREVQSQWRDDPNLVNIYWFEIDSQTHGSVSIFKSKAAFEANIARQEEHRSKSTRENGITMTHEAQGECFAILHD